MPAEQDHRRRVLFLDDDTKLLETVGQLFGVWSKNAWHIQLASTTAKALKALDEHKIDLVVLDIQMPVVDGMQFLQLLHRRYPHLPKVVMTGFATEENRANATKHGVELFLEKPRSTEGFETVFAALNELVSWQPQEGFRGVLRKVGLPEVIQLECLGRKSSVLEVAAKTIRGKIYIESGAIIHAAMGDLKGQPAFNSLLGLDGGEFNLRPFVHPPERTIDGQWEFLLMEAARVRDETAEQSASTATSGETTTDAAPGRAAVEMSAEDNPAAGPDPARGEGGAAMSGASPQTISAPNEQAPHMRSVEEFIVCSSQGDVLYEWQCAGIEMRLKLFDFIARRAAQFGQAFPLGNFDRVEIIGPECRALTQVHSDRRLFVRTASVPRP